MRTTIGGCWIARLKRAMTAQGSLSGLSERGLVDLPV